MANIAIVGAGNVGANSAFFIAERNIGDVVMHDIQEGMATGKALDMMEAAPIRGYQRAIRGTDNFDDILESDIAVVAAGHVREPGMKREDLYIKNTDIIDDIAAKMTGYTGTVVIATEPVDVMVMRFQRKSGLKATRVIGLGGVLDSTRLRFALSRAVGVTPENISATVIGRHADRMLPLADYCRVSGVPASVLLGSSELERVFEETRHAGDVIVEMSQRASSYYGPSAAAADVVQAIAWDTRRILPVSFMWEDHYGVKDVAMSLPAVLGWTGVVRVMEPTLSSDQIEELKRSAEELNQIYCCG